MNGTGPGTGAGMERYPRLLSVWAHRSGRPVIQELSPKERTYIDREFLRYMEDNGRGYIVQ